MANTYTGSDVGKAGLNVAEEDGSPSVFGVTKINVSDGTLTDNGGGEVTISTGGGGGGSPGGSDGQVQYNNGGSFGGASALNYDDTNNRVGVGTSSPVSLLEVNGDTSDDVALTITNSQDTSNDETVTLRLKSTRGTDSDFEIVHDAFGNTEFFSNQPDTDTEKFLQFANTPKVVFNPDAIDMDFQIASDDVSNMFFVDAGNNRVGIGEGTPLGRLHITESTSTNPKLIIEHDGDQSATGRIQFLDSVGGGNGQVLGTVEFSGNNSASEEILYARITGDSHVYTDANERGRLIASVQRAGVLTEVMRWSGFEVSINEGSSDVNFKVEGNNDDPLFFCDAGLERVAVGLDNLESQPNAKFHVLNTSASEFVAMFQSNEDGASAAPDVGIFRDSATPANNDDLGHLRFRGNHAATSGGSAAGAIDYADMFAEAVNVVTGSEDGRLSLRTALGGSTVNRIYLDSTDTTINLGNNDLDFIVRSVNSNQMIFVDAANDRVGIATNAPACELDVRGSDDSGFVDFRVSRDNDQYTGIRNSDASGGYVINHSREGNKKPLYIDSVHNSAGSAAGAANILFRTGALSSPTERMRILESNGNVGIGVASPAQKLHVSGTIRQTASTSSVLVSNANGDIVSSSNVQDIAYLETVGTFFPELTTPQPALPNSTIATALIPKGYIQVDVGGAQYLLPAYQTA